MYYRQYKCNIASISYYSILALTHKICGISPKMLQKPASLKLLWNLSVKTTAPCYFPDIPQILQVEVSNFIKKKKGN